MFRECKREGKAAHLNNNKNNDDNDDDDDDDDDVLKIKKIK